MSLDWWRHILHTKLRQAPLYFPLAQAAQQAVCPAQRERQRPPAFATDDHRPDDYDSDEEAELQAEYDAFAREWPRAVPFPCWPSWV